MQSLTLESATEKSPGRVAELLPRLHVKAFTGGMIVVSFILIGIFGPLLAPHDPNKQELTAMMKAPQGVGALNVLGTDNLGRDILSRGSRRSRSASPSRLMPSTVTKMQRPGKSGSHQAVLM